MTGKEGALSFSGGIFFGVVSNSRASEKEWNDVYRRGETAMATTTAQESDFFRLAVFSCTCRWDYLKERGKYCRLNLQYHNPNVAHPPPEAQEKK